MGDQKREAMRPDLLAIARDCGADTDFSPAIEFPNLLALEEFVALAQRPIQLQGAASPQGEMLDAEAAKPVASNGPDGQSEAASLAADLTPLLLQAVEALENAHAQLDDDTADAGYLMASRECARIAAALRQRIGRE